MPQHSSSQRTSIALFLATASIVGGSTALAAPADAAVPSQFSPERAQLLANAGECVPVGEGENCERETRRQRKSATTSEPAPATTADPAPASTGESK